MPRVPLVIHKNSFILSTLSCSGTLQIALGSILLQEPEWGVGIVSMLVGFGTIFGTSRAAKKIPVLHAAKKTFLESLLAFFAGVLAIWGGLGLSIVGVGFTEGLDYGILSLLFAVIPLSLASAVFQYLKFKRWIRYLKIVGIVDDLKKSDIVCRDMYNTYPRMRTLHFIRKHNPGAAEQIKASRNKKKLTGTTKSEEDISDKKSMI